jgi:hypothetical protein
MLKIFEEGRTEPLSEEEALSLLKKYFPELSEVSELCR